MLDESLKRKSIAMYFIGAEIMHRLCTPQNAGMIERENNPVIYFA